MLNHWGSVSKTSRGAAAANTNRPKGQIADDEQNGSITSTDQMLDAERISEDLVVVYRNGAAVRLKQWPMSKTSVENVRSIGLVNGQALHHVG